MNTEPLIEPIKKTDTITSDNPYENYPSSSEEEFEDLETGIIIISKKETKYDKCSKCIYGTAGLFYRCIFNKCTYMLYDCLVNCYLKRHNEKLISKGYMKMFLATEALELRYSLEIMQIYHAINLVFLPMGVIMKILDLIFLLLTIYTSIRLEKPYILGYSITLFIMVCIGISHFPFPHNFVSHTASNYFFFEIFVYAIACYQISN